MLFINYRRVNSSNTTQASQDAIKLLQNPELKAAVFSTSLTKDDGTAQRADGPDTNWPYFSAAIRVADEVHIFDSVLLNAARVPRDAEVRAILDAAQSTEKVYFMTDKAAGFTACLDPHDAAMRFCNQSVKPLTETTRSDFWLKVSNGTPESDFDRIRGK